MNRIEIATLYARSAEYSNQQVTLCGWIRTLRDSKGIAFIELNDGSCFKNLQVVIEESELENYKDITRQNIGAALTVVGTLVETPEGRQPFEIKGRVLTVEGESTPDYPLQKKRHTLEFLRTMPYLRARTNTLGASFRIRSAVSYAIHRFFAENGFVYIHTPIITGSDCEGAGEMFRVSVLDPATPPKTPNGEVDYAKDFFGAPSRLTVSGQLEAESMAMAYGKVYTFGPTFRAENSNTTRHAAEFWMIEPEIAFADLQDDMKLAEAMLKYVIDYVLAHCSDEIDFFTQHYDNELRGRLESLVKSDFKVCTYTHAIELLEQREGEVAFPVQWGSDLQTEHERYLAETVFGCPVFIIDYPKEIKSFYMRCNDDGKTVAAMDLLVPGVGEIIGGSQREERFDVLLARMQECGLNPDEYQWYLDLRRFGGARHAGFGLGLERLLMYLTCVGNIRDVLPFPRTPGSME